MSAQSHRDVLASVGGHPDHAAGRARLVAFLPRAGSDYAGRRNHDEGPGKRSTVSCLSPWIRHRLLTEEEVVASVLARYGRDGAETFLQEVFWRTYFKGWLEHRPQVWRRYRQNLAFAHTAMAADGDLSTRYRAAIGGETAIHCFDAWNMELQETGYLHNHARMWFASIWIFTLRLPWVLGADFFLRHLIDGDAASNTLSWRWVAGLHTKGKTYLARADNIAKYTAGRFHPVGQLAEVAVPLEEPEDPGCSPIPPEDRLQPNVPYVLLVTEEDYSPQDLAVERPPEAIFSLAAPHRRSPAGVSPIVAGFAEAAVAAGRAEAIARWGATDASGWAEPADAPQDWAAILADVAQRFRVDTIVTPYIPTGPIADAIDAARPDLERSGIRVMMLRRSFDQVSWPHATRGYFGMKQKLPEILNALDFTG